LLLSRRGRGLTTQQLLMTPWRPLNDGSTVSCPDAAHRQACRGIGVRAKGLRFPAFANAKNHHQVVMKRHFENVVEKLALSGYETRRHLAFAGPEFPPAFFATVLFPVGALSFRDLIVGFIKRGVIRDITDPAPCGMALAPVGGIFRSLLGRVKFFGVLFGHGLDPL